MREWQSQSHVRWYCRYHVVWVPKFRKRAIFGEMPLPPVPYDACDTRTTRVTSLSLVRDRRNDDWRWCTDPAPSVRHDRPPGHRSDGR